LEGPLTKPHLPLFGEIPAPRADLAPERAMAIHDRLREIAPKVWAWLRLAEGRRGRLPAVPKGIRSEVMRLLTELGEAPQRTRKR
jgi:hypothetical protein